MQLTDYILQIHIFKKPLRFIFTPWHLGVSPPLNAAALPAAPRYVWVVVVEVSTRYYAWR